MSVVKIKPKSDCKDCNGSGEVFDTVPYGSTTALLPSFCECVESQLSENYDDEDIEIDFDEHFKELYDKTLVGQCDNLRNILRQLVIDIFK